MKTNELRIGNIVSYKDIWNAYEDRKPYYGKCIYTVAWVSKYRINIDIGRDARVTVDDTFFEPVPITEEWLEKFGFECRESSTCKEWHIGYNSITHDWLFSLTWLDKPELINAPNAPFYRNGRHTVYYVHQLQNLFFALTGEELTIKEGEE